MSRKATPSKTGWNKVSEHPIPMETPVLVFLEKESLGRRIHSAEFNSKNISVIGHYFAWDLPKPTHWMYCPEDPV